MHSMDYLQQTRIHFNKLSLFPWKKGVLKKRFCLSVTMESVGFMMCVKCLSWANGKSKTVQESKPITVSRNSKAIYITGGTASNIEEITAQSFRRYWSGFRYAYSVLFLYPDATYKTKDNALNYCFQQWMGHCDLFNIQVVSLTGLWESKLNAPTSIHTISMIISSDQSEFKHK